MHSDTGAELIAFPLLTWSISSEIGRHLEQNLQRCGNLSIEKAIGKQDQGCRIHASGLYRIQLGNVIPIDREGGWLTVCLFFLGIITSLNL